MDRDQVIAQLKAAEPKLRAVGIVHAALFGSLARGEARANSDIDIMVDLDPQAHIGVWEYVGLVHVLEDMFPVKVDVSNRRAMRDFVRPSAERDAIYAF